MKERPKSFERLTPGQVYLAPQEGILPDFGSDSSELSAMGIVFGEKRDDDPMFRDAVLPDGWTLRSTNIPTLYEVVDTSGARRATVRYVASSDSRSATIKAVRRFEVVVHKLEDLHVGVVLDQSNAIYRAKPRDTQEEALAAANEFLSIHWPEWESYSQYWD